jgi:hypothetical protein
MVTVVCAYFNPFTSSEREIAYYEFREGLERSGISVLCVEQSFLHVPRVSRSSDISLPCGELFWQKECLLQLGIDEALSRGESHIVLADADIIFETANAWDYIMSAFEEFDWFQPFETVSLGYAEGTIRKKSALSYPDPVRYGIGHPGCCWAGTAEFFRTVRLYPFALLGGGDVVMTHLLATCWKHGASSERFVDLATYLCDVALYPELLPSILEWAAGIGRTHFRQGHASGVHIQAINHGSYASRRYHDRYAVWHSGPQKGGGPIPGRDFSLNSRGLLAWAEYSSTWRPVVSKYFESRERECLPNRNSNRPEAE